MVILELERKITGSVARGEIGEKDSPTPRNRMMVAYRGLSTNYGPTELHRQSLALGKKELKPIKTELGHITGELLPALVKDLKEAGAPIFEN